jgi:hypothetical protein
MPNHMRYAVLAGVAVTLAACGGGGDQTGAAATRAAHTPARNAAAPTITSTLDGRRVLPQRVRWIARPSAPTTDVSAVEFLIDGTLRAVEHQDPYNYGSDDFNGHLGWLVTSWLKPGPHRFTVRARLTNGQIASSTVVATVKPAPRPPAALARHWRRHVSRRTIERLLGPDGPPSGIWQLLIDRTGAWSLDPMTSGIAEHIRTREHTIHIDAGLWTAPLIDGHVAPGADQLTRAGHSDLGAFFCREDGPPASYRWNVTEDRLTLTAVHEPCPFRRAIWQGTWTPTA